MLIRASLLAACLLAPADCEPPKAEPFAVVELFTSEGCSSCPPADRLLGELVADAARDGTRVFPLAFHVDYWDGLGWKDPYASRSATDRQRDYAKVFRGAGVYTPQMIVNGTDQFVGSDREHARASIKTAMSEAARVGIQVSATRDGDRVRVRAEIDGAPEGSVVVAAVVERGLESRVKAGENSGRTLKHENVVRDFAQAPARAATDLELRTPAGDTVIAFVQDATSRRILGAARAAVPVKP